jgi:hypothetical protein
MIHAIALLAQKRLEISAAVHNAERRAEIGAVTLTEPNADGPVSPFSLLPDAIAMSNENGNPTLKLVHKIFPLGHFVISLMFVICSIALLAFAAIQLWSGVAPYNSHSVVQRVNLVLEGLSLLVVSVAALELGQTLLEEEVQRRAQMSAPTRVRRFLSRFMVVLVVSLSIETLVTVFRFGQEAPEFLPYAAATGIAAAALLVGWGVFVRLNRAAEDLEPEAMQQAKREDRKVKS